MFGGASSNAIPPVLIQKTPFPPLPSVLASRSFDLKTDIIVSKTGAVVRAELINSSGDREWDSLAVQSIMTWKYSPATLNGKPIQMRISQAAHVVYTPPLTMILSQIVCNTAEEADSVFMFSKRQELRFTHWMKFHDRLCNKQRLFGRNRHSAIFRGNTE